MTDNKMLQAVLDRISLVDRKVDNLDKKMENGFKEVNIKIDKVNDRLDKQGASLAYLEDDAPTIKDFSKLEKRVRKIEIKLAM